jgi:uncharacterized RDD family membrane protein YckC
MDSGYFVLENDGQTGPLTLEELIEKEPDVHTRILSPNENGWKDACDLPELYNYFLGLGLDFPTEDNLASFWIRLAAFVIDMVIWVIMINVIMVILFYTGHFAALAHVTDMQDVMKVVNRLPSSDLIILQIIGNGSLLLYNALCESSALKGSLGKKLFNLAVVNADGEGISFLNALVRSFGKVMLLTLFWGIGFISIFFTEHKQGLHDLLAKTYVIRRNV